MSTDRLLDISKALSDRTRLRLLLACRGGEVCVCQLTALVELAPSTVSKHLSILKQAGLVASRKRGRWMHYRLVEQPDDVASEAMALAERACAWDGSFRSDRRRLKEITAMDPEELCRLQRDGSACCPPAAVESAS